MKIFVDTNILLDVLRRREPLYQTSAIIWSWVETGEIEGCISAISFNNAYYVIRRTVNARAANKALTVLRDTFDIVDLNTQIMNQAIDAGFKDFEDAIQFFSAIHAGVDYLITRNVKDFPARDIPVLTPEAFLELLN